MKRLMFICCVAVMFFAISYGGDSMLVKGADAPLFELKTAEGTVVKLADYKDKKYVVLVFYPGDETPVCTKQLCEIRDDYASFEKRDAVVFGVNPASDKSHAKFTKKNNFQFPLLIDEKGAVAARYLAKGVMMNKRSVYVIDTSGKIVFAERGKPAVADILAAIPDGATEKAPPAIKLQIKTEE